MNLEKVRDAIRAGRVNITNHADEEMENDGIWADQLYFAVANAEIIEDYPNDFPFPSALVFGLDEDRRPIHSVIAYSCEYDLAFVVTVYIPDPERWVNFRKRRKNRCI